MISENVAQKLNECASVRALQLIAGQGAGEFCPVTDGGLAGLNAERHVRGQSVELLQHSSDAALRMREPVALIGIFFEMNLASFKRGIRKNFRNVTHPHSRGLAKGCRMNTALDGQAHIVVGEVNHLPTIRRLIVP